MSSTADKASAPEAGGGPDAGEVSFPFPFPPYAVQTRLMESLFSVISRGHHGIFESPTGTGKTLSIICSVLYWLRHHAPLFPARQREASRAAAKPSSGPASWLDDLEEEASMNDGMERQRRYERRIARLRDRLRRARTKDRQRGAKRKRKPAETDGGAATDPEDEFLITDDTAPAASPDKGAERLSDDALRRLAGDKRSARAAPSDRVRISRAMRSSMSGRRILTATTAPSGVTAL